MEDEYSILLKSLNIAVGEVQTRKILEQFKAVAIENHLDYSRRLLHDFLRVAELELNLHHLRNKQYVKNQPRKAAYGFQGVIYTTRDLHQLRLQTH